MSNGNIGVSIEELERRLRQQSLVARFGMFALGADNLDEILHEACKLCSDGLEIRFSKVLEFLPNENEFLIRAGVGWEPGVVGHVRLGGDLASPAGFAFHTGQPVISNHLSGEKRFRTPAVLAEHGIHRAVNVLIAADDRPYGVLEADSTERGDFTASDIAFLQGLANAIAAVVDRTRRMRMQRNSDAFTHSVLDATPDCVMVLDIDGTIQLVNATGLALLEAEDQTTLIGTALRALWPVEEQGRITAAVAGGAKGAVSRFEAFGPTLKGTPKWWEVVIAPIAADGRPAERMVFLSRDVTDRQRAIEAKDALLREKDLLMQEIHHRVKNSLQLVQNLLSLQARASGDSGITAQLAESAARVHTIAAIHDRLYRGGSALEVEIRPYLSGLIEDLREAMASTLQGRSMHLHADNAIWPAARVSTLGLVLTELVTNALKYGAGRITITFSDPPAGHSGAGQAVLMVEDEGAGLPADFDPTKCRGMGMRLVTGLVRGASSGIELDRSVANTRFIARLPAYQPPEG